MYKIWLSLKQRCTNPRNKGYKNYGGRGINVCRQWLTSFQEFLEDVGERPSPKHSLDRIDNDGDYEPGNVRWVIRGEQNRNKRGNVLLTWGGKTMLLTDWARGLGIAHATLRSRLTKGWSLERALTTPNVFKQKAPPQKVAAKNDGQDLSPPREKGSGRRHIDRAGKRYGRLVVVRLAGQKGRNFYWLCKCDCGAEKVAEGNCLVTKMTQSCGCLQRERVAAFCKKTKTTHGAAGTLEYHSWCSMKQRCYCRTSQSFPSYGGRGVRVCARWRDSFQAFSSDMGRRPTPAHSLDRINNDAHYSCGQCEECVVNGWPANCRWATPAEQARNRRTSKRRSQH